MRLSVRFQSFFFWGSVGGRNGVIPEAPMTFFFPPLPPMPLTPSEQAPWFCGRPFTTAAPIRGAGLPLFFLSKLGFFSSGFPISSSPCCLLDPFVTRGIGSGARVKRAVFAAVFPPSRLPPFRNMRAATFPSATPAGHTLVFFESAQDPSLQIVD